MVHIVLKLSRIFMPLDKALVRFLECCIWIVKERRIRVAAPVLLLVKIKKILLSCSSLFISLVDAVT